ncbi:hypothetical protein FXN63_00075 [Pigmentiphaga aceris]|uniref:Uncharacterized protein n=1 Tax=Pigmentiphaga aceris TaxID=1940612 RepID=A0A5C0AQP5_9BURK|nr:hypothetical protein [Pigmentiphaga aceris]QEI04409.1 hypothetical protein FXN63_00075 [Pigmentiphaga aceris]
MNFSRTALILSLLLAGNATASSMNLGAAYEVGSGRIGKSLVRYVKSFDTACLGIQVISPDQRWKVLSSSNICTFQGKSFDTEFSYAGFKDISVKPDGVHLTLNLMALRPSKEEYWSCVIPVKGTEIGDLSCADAPNP